MSLRNPEQNHTCGVGVNMPVSRNKIQAYSKSLAGFLCFMYSRFSHTLYQD